MYSRFRGIGVVLLALLLMPQFVFAQSPETEPPPAFVFTPADPGTSYFSVQADPGSVSELTVVLGVDAQSPTEVTTFAGDAYALTNGGFGVMELGDPVSEPTTWLDYPTETLELEPGVLTERSFTVTVPATAQPGQYITGLILQTANPIRVGDSTMLRQTLRRAIAVLITVPGEVRAQFAVDSVSLLQQSATSTLVLAISNTGNILLKPAGEVVLRDSAGTEIVRAPVTMGSVYAGMSTTLEIPIPTRLATGEYAVNATLSDEATGAATGDLHLTLTVEEVSEAQIQPVTVSSFTTEAISNDSGEVQLVQIAAMLENGGSALPSVRLTLLVSKDGELVEEFVINPALALAAGSTLVEARYLPIEGWQTGTYAFALLVEAVDMNTGQSTRLLLIESESTVQVP